MRWSSQVLSIVKHSNCAVALSPWQCITSDGSALPHYCILILYLSLRPDFLPAPLVAEKGLEWALWVALSWVCFLPIRQAFLAEGRKAFCSYLRFCTVTAGYKNVVEKKKKWKCKNWQIWTQGWGKQISHLKGSVGFEKLA